ATFGRDLRAVRPEIKISRPRTSEGRDRLYAGIALGWTADRPLQSHLDRADLGPKQCGVALPCHACDGKGCPYCRPEKFGLPPETPVPQKSVETHVAMFEAGGSFCREKTELQVIQEREADAWPEKPEFLRRKSP